MQSSKESTTIMPLDSDQYRLGYILNVLLSEDACRAITSLQEELERQFPGLIWPARLGEAHITLIDLLTPGMDYGRDKDSLFKELEQSYTKAFEDVIQGQRCIRIVFDKIEVYNTAIIIRGRDDGSFRRIREQFHQHVKVLPGTKTQAPDFVHSTICRFRRKVNLSDIKRAGDRLSVNFEEEVTHFLLSRETKLFMQDYHVIRRFPLRENSFAEVKF